MIKFTILSYLLAVIEYCRFMVGFFKSSVNRIIEHVTYFRGSMVGQFLNYINFLEKKSYV